MSVTGELLSAFSSAVKAHNSACEVPANGIGMAHFRMDRLGLYEGEEVLPGVVLTADGGPADSFRVLCDKEHNVTDALTESREMVTV